MRRSLSIKLIFVLAVTSILVTAVLSRPTPVQAANPSTISFQGKVVNANGTNVTNGSYTFLFRLYNTAAPTSLASGTCASDGTCWWEETDTITVTNGIFQVELGGVCALNAACNSSHSGIDFNTNNALYLTMKFNGDANGYMSPTMHFNSVPYALNADKVGGVAASSIVQLGATQSGNINISSGTITSGLINGQTISSSANFTGTLAVAGASSLTLGTSASADGAIIFKSSAAGSNTVTL